MQVTYISKVLICNQEGLVQTYSGEKEMIELEKRSHRLTESMGQPSSEQREALQASATVQHTADLL